MRVHLCPHFNQDANFQRGDTFHEYQVKGRRGINYKTMFVCEQCWIEVNRQDDGSGREG